MGVAQAGAEGDAGGLEQTVGVGAAQLEGKGREGRVQKQVTSWVKKQEARQSIRVLELGSLSLRTTAERGGSVLRYLCLLP